MTLCFSLFAIPKFELVFSHQSNNNANHINLKGTKIIAHRAKCFIKEPENSILGIKDSIKYRINYVEIDVQESKDGVVVLMHDENLKRLTGLNKRVSQLNYNQIKKLNILSLNPFDTKYEKIPTLDQVIQHINGKLNLIIDIKPYGNTADLTKKVVYIIQKHNLVNKCIVQSLSYSILTTVKNLNPNIITGYVVTNPTKDLFLMNVNFYSVKQNLVTKDLVKMIHKSNREVYVWPINTQVDMLKFINLNVDGIITNVPKALIYKNSYFNQLKTRNSKD